MKTTPTQASRKVAVCIVAFLKYLNRLANNVHAPKKQFDQYLYNCHSASVF